MLQAALRRLSKAAHVLNPVTLIRTLDQVGELSKATRELSKSVDELRTRTEQLLAIQETDWELREKVSRLSERLEPTRIQAHISQAVEKARIQCDPFPHVVIDKWLPHDVYDLMIDAMPPSVFFADRDQSRQQLPVPFPIASEYSRRVWTFVAFDMVGRMVGPMLTDKLHGTIREYLHGYCARLPDDLDLSLHVSNGRIMLRRPGYVIRPHRDPKWGFVTCLVYLARPGDDPAYGTQLYRVTQDEEAPDGKPYYIDEDRCELVKAVPFRANSMLVMLNTTGAHGASIPADAKPTDLERYLYQFRLGPTERTIATLLTLMPDDKRCRWGGAKTDRAERAY